MNDKNMIHKITSGIGWAYGEKLLAQLISLVVSVVLARILDPDHYGIISIVTVFINILDALASGGFGNALIQKKDSDDHDFNTVCWFSIGLSLVLYFILYMISPWLSNFYDMSELVWVTRIMGIRVIISAFNSVQHAYVQKHMDFKRFFFATLGGTLLSAIVGIWMAVAGFGVWALVAQYLTNSIVDTIVLFFTIEWKPKFELSIVRLKNMMEFGLKMLGATLINTLQDNIRSLVVGKVFSSKDLAYYNQGKKYPSILMNNLVGSVQKVSFPAFSSKQNNRNEIKKMMRSAIRLSSFVLVPIIAGMVAVADNFIYVLLTDKWMACVPYLRILSLIYLTRTMNTIFQSSLLAIGKSSINLFHELVVSILSLVLIYLAAFGLHSILLIAWSYVVVMIVGTAIFAYFVSKHFKYTVVEMICDYFPYLFLSIIMAVLVYILGRVAINKFILLFIQILVGGIFYIVMSKILKFRELNKCIVLVKGFVSKK